jgi:hypothetical protein
MKETDEIVDLAELKTYPRCSSHGADASPKRRGRLRWANICVTCVQ